MKNHKNEIKRTVIWFGGAIMFTIGKMCGAITGRIEFSIISFIALAVWFVLIEIVLSDKKKTTKGMDMTIDTLENLQDKINHNLEETMKEFIKDNGLNDGDINVTVRLHEDDKQDGDMK